MVSGVTAFVPVKYPSQIPSQISKPNPSCSSHTIFADMVVVVVDVVAAVVVVEAVNEGAKVSVVVCVHREVMVSFDPMLVLALVPKTGTRPGTLVVAETTPSS